MVQCKKFTKSIDVRAGVYKMKRKNYFILFFLLHLTIIMGQDRNKEFMQAEDLLAKSKFAEALQQYQNLLKYDSSNANLNFKIGICYLNSRSQKAKAVCFMNKSLLPTTSYYKEGLKKQANTPLIANEFLGVCHFAYNFKQLNKSYETFTKIILDNKGKNLSAIEVSDLKIEMNKIGDELKEFSTSSIDLKIENTDKNHVSSFVNYSSSLSTDQSMVFTFQPPVKDGQNGESVVLYEDLKISFDSLKIVKAALDNSRSSVSESDNMLKAISVSAININKNEATVGTSEDSQTILTYKDDKGEGNLYISRLNGNQWSAPGKLDKTINTKGWEENEYISANGNMLYFTSNREGGYGGIDIYKSKKMANGEWGKATNLGPAINTCYDERAPFIHTDGVTLYFSSNGHNTARDFDIFTSTLSESRVWSKPVNVGYPASEIQDGVTDPLTAGNNKMYSSNSSITDVPEQGGTEVLTETDQNKRENYTVTFVNQKQVALTLLKGKVVETSGIVPDHVAITITDNVTKEIISTYSSNIKTGAFVFILPPGRNTNITYQADEYLFYSKNIDLSDNKKCNNINETVRLSPITQGSKIILNNIFFDPAKASICSASNVELNNIFNLLTANPGLTVEFSNYMISKENAKNNKSISQQRAQAVMEYFIKNGISSERLKAKGNVKYKQESSEKKTNKKQFSEKLSMKEWTELKIINNTYIKKNS